jgi:hypothetical protein
MDPRDRILDGEYQLLDGTVIANVKNDLLDGSLDAPINMDETGTTLLGAFEVWTGTDVDGTGDLGPGTCTVWTTNSNAIRGQSGTANATDTTWTDNLSETCDVFNRLYCFADAFAPGALQRVVRGGNWAESADGLAATEWNSNAPTHSDGFTGFRVVSIPEPGQVIGMLVALVTLTVLRRKGSSRGSMPGQEPGFGDRT